MTALGWEVLIGGCRWFRRPGRHAVAAYSEFMPPPRVGGKAYGADQRPLFDAADPFGWPISEYEELVELRPGLSQVAGQVGTALRHLADGRPAHGIARAKLVDNPYWPPELARRAGTLAHERFVLLLPLALSRSQDDKGRVRWTLFGSSEQGPERAFWKSFYTAPGQAQPAERGTDFIRQLLHTAYGLREDDLADLRQAGFRILPSAEATRFPSRQPDVLPAWTAPFLLRRGEALEGVRYLLTFRPFAELPGPIRRAYLAGGLHLLPFPGSLVFWGAPPIWRLQQDLPLALQVAMLPLCERHEDVHGLRVPQSGWLHEPHPDHPEFDPRHGVLRNTYRRTHRWARIHRHEDELGVADGEDRVAHVLFSTEPGDVGLYGKPMARNAQIWTQEYRLLFDGPCATRRDLARAAAALREGGPFGYRFHFPPMQVGRHAVYWQRPLAACLSHFTGQMQVFADFPLGYLTAYRADRPDLSQPVELWPRLLAREPYLATVEGFALAHEHRRHQQARNVRNLLDAWHVFGQRPLPASFARHMLALPKAETLDDWLSGLPGAPESRKAGRRLVEQVRARLAPGCVLPAPRRGSTVVPSFTFPRTARRAFETAYWKTIAHLAAGRYVHKDNGDCAQDPATQSLVGSRRRDLEALGDFLLDYYHRTIAQHRMAGRAYAGELPFLWQTDFDFPWLGGWLGNQQGRLRERNLMVVIPGRDRSRAVIMADHYDTAYMEDVYDHARGGSGARLSAAGADDNHSATAALMLAAPVFLDLSRSGRLGCDVWLVHLTGEEFPSDCMGARHLTQSLVEGTLALRVPGRRPLDLSRTTVAGVYVLDMVAHNRDREHDVFQISPGTGGPALELAHHAHLANMIWNANVPAWNSRPPRRGRGRAQRSDDPDRIPGLAAHPQLHGEVRLPADPRSSLYNTDGQIFSDAGVPVVLFMEDYDINRTGYHDTHDTMANIDLDYGAAVAAIAIESVARAAGR